MRQRVGEVGRILGLAAVYIVVARLGLSLGAVARFATLVWPPTGLSVAALLLFGVRLWPGVFIGAFAANVLTGASLPVACGIGVGNTAEALACVFILTRAPGFSVALDNVSSVARLIVAALLGTMVSASIGVASLYAGGVVGAHGWRETWRAWWLGDIVGALVVAPVILVWSVRTTARAVASRVEAVALGVALALVSVSTFFGDVRLVSELSTPLHQADVLLAVLVWASLRFGQRGAATAVFCVSAAAVTATVLGHGPFSRDGLSQALMSLQTFMAVLVVTFLFVGATIDERRFALGMAREAQRDAALANQAKSEFLAVVSHELRTPLNAIAGFAQLLQEGVYGRLNEKQADAVARIRRNQQRLLLLVDEVLGFVSAEKGRIAVHLETVRVADAFDAVQPLVKSQLEEHHCVLEREGTGARLAVQADPKSLQQILMSLVSNASKFNRDGGTVTLGADRQGDSVRIWVRDTGTGIPQEQIDRIFEPFFQTERATTRRESGIGLGLTIARDLARRMEGEVTVASEPGHGTTASVLLPAA